MAERRDVVRMRDTIEKAFFKLNMENQNRITVKDVLEEANISRGTFYAYYKDIPDLEQNMVRRIVMICRRRQRRRWKTASSRTSVPRSTSFFRFWRSTAARSRPSIKTEIPPAASTTD